MVICRIGSTVLNLALKIEFLDLVVILRYMAQHFVIEMLFSLYILLPVGVRDNLHWTLLLCLAGLEDLVGHPEVLAEVGDLLATLGTRIPSLEVDELRVRVVVGLLVRLVVAELAAVPGERANSDNRPRFFFANSPQT